MYAHIYTAIAMKALQVVTVLVTLLMLGHAIHTEYFVTPNQDTPCPALPCHTLSYYLENITQYFTSNTRISFLHGVHELHTSDVWLIDNVSNFILTGYNMSSSHAAKIVCMEPATLKFRNIVSLEMKHLSILYCGYPTMTFNDNKVWSSAAILLIDIISLKLSDITVENSTGYGMVGINVLGNSSISCSRFMFNNYYTLSSTNCSYGLGTCIGGNMYLRYERSVATVAGSTNLVTIESCVFSDGVDVSDNTQPKVSSGLTVFLHGVQYKVDVFISNVVSTRNIAKIGANLFFYANSIGSIKITNSTSSMANYLLSPGEILHTYGFEFHYDSMYPSGQLTTTNHSLLHISDSRFYDNNGGGMNIQLYTGYSNTKIYQVVIKSCLFQRNQSPIGSGVSIRQVSLLSNISGLEVLVQDSTFINNMTPEPVFNMTFSNSFDVVSVNGLKDLKIINCRFTMNKQTALRAFDSTLYFGGHVIFSENNGTFGGAMVLQGGSRFYLMPHTHIEITHNHAKRGGGIYVVDEDAATTIPCFFQLLNLQYPYLYIDAVLILENNTAEEACRECSVWRND